MGAVTTALLVAGCCAWAAVAVAAARHRSALAVWCAALAPAPPLLALPGGARAGVALATVGGAGLLLSLPSGRPGTRARRTLAGVALLAIVGVVFPAVGAATAAVVGGLGLAAALRRARSAAPAPRQPTLLVVAAVLLLAEVALAAAALAVLFDGARVAGAVVAGAALGPPVAVAVAARPTAGRPAAGADALGTAAVAGGGLVAVLCAVVVTIVAMLGGRPAGAQREAVVVSLVAALLAAGLFPAVHERLRLEANRIRYGAEDSPDDVARAFGSRLTRAVPLDELLLQLAETLRRALRLESAEVWTGTDGTYTLAAAVPHRSAPPLRLAGRELEVVTRAGPSGGSWVALWVPELARRHDPARLRVTPLAHAGRLLGLVATSRPVDADPYDERDDQVLADLARQMGAALHNVALDHTLADSVEQLRRTNAELRASRARIVASGDAERRRVERDLHDGAQQQLLSLVLKLRLARDEAVAAAQNGAAVDRIGGLFDELRDELALATAQLRSLAHGIYPPLLASGGLAEALGAATARAPVPAMVRRCPLGRYPPDVETAVYFCCMEAMQNAAKHAGPGASVTIDAVEEPGGWLQFEVRDDGVGLPAGEGGPGSGDPAGAGHGLTNMSDRVGAVGGSLRFESMPGRGLRIVGRVPIVEVPPSGASGSAGTGS